ncbi:MAG TPA: GTPase Era [Fimbriimonadales bacterium]|nr:GTPase Era [Fimbriimonadales bacterium]
MKFRCGVVVVVGRPNVGKSTLINAIVEKKVSIVSPRPQTTRKLVLAVANVHGAQIIFRDTPGIHKPRSKLEKALVDKALQTLHEADVILFVVDVSKLPNEEDKRIASLLREIKDVPIVVALNKMDRLRPEYVYSHYTAYEELMKTKGKKPPEMMYTNALTGENVDKLVKLLVDHLPERKPLYPSTDFYTDQTLREMAEEIIREKVLSNIREEIPYSVAVKIENWEEDFTSAGEPLTRIEAVIFVGREAHKPILIGDKGQMIKKIGTAARLELEKLLRTRVYLGLHVKVKEKWIEKPHSWKELGILS